MKLLRRGSSDNSDNDDVSVDTAAATPEPSTAATAGKGRPTPSRREAEGRRRGPVAPPPMTSKEARARRKANRGSKDERKAAAASRRAEAAERRSKMLAGDEAYMLPRDKGPVRGYVRDIIDARRNLVGMFMPLALVLIMAMFVSPALQAIVTLGMLIMMVFMVVEGIYLGYHVNNRVRARFPDTPDGGFKLGWYAFVRASQIRKLRAPSPRVRPGDAI
ncbi:DUF3043 domain-containing protein [Rhodococcus rhodnii]|uniref:Integral membrane protein n=2 Tax=Rhodococcus rhodnii TaxID=38312 RepID=R7WS98_9NOCA|nr:DUF3043 domain-containing protein [Rhodococcus rhodnii]EOM78181.1 hypothetical protein Rrhod_0516 [Rhodococcus rhodnii LMG 5362]TXG91439.1 DUF3043 domain-containing protein [Rhodococcus rhodnii]